MLGTDEFKELFQLVEAGKHFRICSQVMCSRTEGLFGVVKDDTERVATTRSQPAHTVPQIHPVDSTRAAHRPVPDGKDDGVAASERDDLGPRLHSRALLDQNELASREIDPGL